MQQYGNYKIRYKVPGHGHKCSICVPGVSKKEGRAKARRNWKKEYAKADSV